LRIINKKMTEVVTTNTIISFFETAVRERKPISPDLWMESAMKLNVLIGNENDLLFELEQECGRFKSEKSISFSVAKAVALLEAEDIYLQTKKQKAKIEQIKEFIRLAKKQAQITSDEMRSGL